MLNNPKRGAPRSRLLRHSLLGFSALVAAGVAGGAQAQENSVDELVVTARRVEERLIDVPLQVTALGTDSLQKARIVDIRGLNNLAPSMNYQGASGGRVGTGRLFFRGLTAGNGSQATKASAFIDGIYIAGSAQDIPFDYLQRVEALPGPQSVQFGRATFGGALNYVTRDPGTTTSGFANATYASFDDINVNGYLGGPIAGDTLLASLFVGYQKYGAPDSWKSAPDPLHPNGVRQYATNTTVLAAKLIWKPTDDFRIELRTQPTYDHDAPTWFYFAPDSSRTPYSTLPNGTVVRYPQGVVSTDTYPGSRQMVDKNYDLVGDPWRRNWNTRSSGEANWHVANHDLTFVLANETELNKSDGYDVDDTYFPGFEYRDVRLENEANSAEFRITSDATKRFRYAIGVYGLHYKSSSANTLLTRYTCNTVCVTPTPDLLVQNTTSIPALQAGGLGGAIVARNTTTLTNTSQLIRDKSVFGSVSFDVTDQLTVTAEARAQSERIVTTNNLTQGLIGAATFKAVLPRVNIQYKLGRNAQVYALYSEGNNPGGFNTSPLIGTAGSVSTAANKVFDEEKLKNYELGLKGTILDGHITGDLTYYHMLWVNQTVLQSDINGAGTAFSYLVNTGGSKIDGFAAQVEAGATDDLHVRGTLSYTDARFGPKYCSTNKGVFVTGSALSCLSVAGNAADAVPKWSASVSAEYIKPLRGDWNYRLYGLYQYQSGMWDSDVNVAKTQAANVFNLSAGVQNDTISFELFCSNCTQEDSLYRLTRLTDARLGAGAPAYLTVGGTPRRPRQFGATLRYHF